MHGTVTQLQPYMLAIENTELQVFLEGSREKTQLHQKQREVFWRCVLGDALGTGGENTNA